MLKKDTRGMLRSARLAKQWTEEFVCGQVGVKLKTYIRWETGLQIPRLASLEVLCRIFSMSVVELGFLESLPDASPSQQDVEQVPVDDTSTYEDILVDRECWLRSLLCAGRSI